MTGPDPRSAPLLRPGTDDAEALLPAIQAGNVALSYIDSAEKETPSAVSTNLLIPAITDTEEL